MPISAGGKPASIFGRDREWGLLAGFVDDPTPGNRLAVVYGRRRQGKTTLLQHIADSRGCFYWEAAEQSRTQNLASVSAAWTAYRQAPGPIRFRSWEEALGVMLAPPGEAAPAATGSGSRTAPSRLLFDEVGYLVATAPEFPSLLQRFFGPRYESAGAGRVVLCGSIYAQMTKLLAAGQPLRGRHSLEVDVRPFDARTAAAFWGLEANPAAAFRLHALVGGTPAYLRFVGGQHPARGNVGDWAVRFLLDPSSPLFHEGSLLVAEDPTLVDKALYWSVLGAVAEGSTRRSDLAASLGRSAPALKQPLDVLRRGAWIELVPDPFHRGASTVALREPIVRTARVLIEPERRRLDLGRARDVWEDAQPRLSRLVYGPHLEWMVNDWAVRHASAATVGAAMRASGPGILRERGNAHQIDLVAVAPDRHDVDRITAIGEVKAGQQLVGIGELTRLDQLATALGARAAPSVKRLLVSLPGFTAELRRAARTRPDVELIDIDRLYNGD